MMELTGGVQERLYPGPKSRGGAWGLQRGRCFSALDYVAPPRF